LFYITATTTLFYVKLLIHICMAWITTACTRCCKCTALLLPRRWGKSNSFDCTYSDNWYSKLYCIRNASSNTYI